MGNDERTITAATVTLTIELFDLGTYGPGSSIDQAKFGAAARLSQLLGIEVSKDHLRVESVSTSAGNRTGKIEAIRS
jgi:hypothetical protein